MCDKTPVAPVNLFHGDGMSRNIKSHVNYMIKSVLLPAYDRAAPLCKLITGGGRARSQSTGGPLPDGHAARCIKQ